MAKKKNDSEVVPVSGKFYQVLRDPKSGYQVWREIMVIDGEVRAMQDAQPCTQSDLLAKAAITFRNNMTRHNTEKA